MKHYQPETGFRSYFYPIIAFFYLGQGFSLGSLVLLLPLYIHEELQAADYTAAVSLSAAIIFPWYVKFIFGFLSDNYPVTLKGMQLGRRRPYLALATIFSLIGWLTLGLHDTAGFLFFLSGLSLAIGSAMADSVVDGQVTEITPTEKAGRMQGIAWGARGFGLGMAGVISANLVQWYDWQTMFYFASFFGISISVITMILPQRYQKVDYTMREFLVQLKEILFHKKNMLKSRIAFFVLSGMALSIVPLLPIIMEKEMLYTFSQIGIGALYFAVGSLMGAIVAGIIFDKRDTQRTYIIQIIVYAIVVAMGALVGLYFLESRWRLIQVLFFVLVGIASGAYEAYQLKIIQQSTHDRFEGSMFSIYTGFSNIGQFAMSGWLIVMIAELLGISVLFSVQIVIVVLIISVVPISRFNF